MTGLLSRNGNVQRGRAPGACSSTNAMLARGWCGANALVLREARRQGNTEIAGCPHVRFISGHCSAQADVRFVPKADIVLAENGNFTSRRGCSGSCRLGCRRNPLRTPPRLGRTRVSAFGLGFYCRTQHEHLLIATRGVRLHPSPSNLSSSVIYGPRREHSRKPDEAYEVIERMYPELPKLELFARKRRPGWTVWGNEIRRDRLLAEVDQMKTRPVDEAERVQL
jgi:hypothetical protein